MRRWQYQKVDTDGSVEWRELSMYRVAFTLYFGFILVFLLGLLASKIRNTISFGLLLVLPIIIASFVAAWWIGGMIWPNRPSQEPPEVSGH
jgi:uncharacterized membrane protein (DUF485 family)